MKRKPRDEYARTIWPPLELTTEQLDLLRRRTEPFLDDTGLRRPLLVVLQEVYMQGMKDAAQAFEVGND